MYIGFYSYAAYVFSLSRDGGATPPHLFEGIWTMNSSSSTRPEPAARRPWLAVSAVGLATFSVVTTEMLPVGLLTSIAGSLGTSMGRAGLMISLPALLAALFAPLVVMAAGGMDRRRILCGLLALLVLANLASALAPSLIWLLAARVLVGFCMGGIWAIAGGLAARLVPQASMGLATSIIFGGVAAASVLGVPLGALIGDFAGWRWAFGGMAGFSALVLALHMAVLPALPATGSASLRQFSHQLANRRLQAGLALTLLLVAGHFMAFTFVRPLLLTVSGFDAQWMSALLLAYGITTLSVGILISSAAMSQMQAMQLSFFYFLPSILLSGFMFPYSGMPKWAQIISQGLPLTYFVRGSRGVFLKEFTLVDMWPHLWPIMLAGLVFGLLAVKSYRRTLN